MSHVPKVMHAFARLLKYPDQHASQTAELLFIVLQHEMPSAARSISEFGAFLERHHEWEIEESYTSTFDVNPACALEVGWHLFGEEYARGMFLVRMREEMRKYGEPEDVELTDHISHVLAVVAAMPDDEAAKFVRACVQPAVEKMRDALEDADTPYRHVLSSLAIVFELKWGTVEKSAQQTLLDSRSSDVDPLHAFPVAEVGCEGECQGSCGGPAVVSLDTSLVNSEPKLPLNEPTPNDAPMSHDAPMPNDAPMRSAAVPGNSNTEERP